MAGLTEQCEVAILEHGNLSEGLQENKNKKNRALGHITYYPKTIDRCRTAVTGNAIDALYYNAINTQPS